MIDRRHAVSVLSLLLLFGPAVQTSAQEPGARVILVLDASGSMWGQIAGRAKIEIAREVVGELLVNWDPDVHLGLATYGHRRKGDCEDIEMLVSPQPVDAAAIQSAVDGIRPKGMTPLSAAVVEAAKQLRYTEERATVILVSDGRETCEADPCAIGSQLEQSGIDFTAHVIGFDVAEAADQEQLRCLATQTGGEFHLASDAASLNQAMQRTVEVTRAPAPAPAPDPKPVPVVTATEVIEAGCSFSGKLIQGDVGSAHVVACPAGCSNSIWGTDTYTGDSSVCTAGMHAGLIGADGGIMGVVIADGRPAYRGTKRNGIQSSDYGKYGSSYTVARTDVPLPTPPAPPGLPSGAQVIEAGCSFSSKQIAGEPGSVHRVNCPADCTGAVWGTDAYTSDSRVCVAALHTGLIPKTGGDVAVVIEGARPAFRGSKRNGVSSSDYGPYGGSFRLGAAGGAAPAAANPAAPPASSQIIEAGCSFNGAQIDGEVGSSHIVDCPADCSGAVWGTDTYTADSRVCVAAQHSGQIPSSGGRVGVVLEAGQPAYRGSKRNGISSSDYGSYRGSFRLTPAAP
jgi:hypothetical protein